MPRITRHTPHTHHTPHTPHTPHAPHATHSHTPCTQLASCNKMHVFEHRHPTGDVDRRECERQVMPSTLSPDLSFFSCKSMPFADFALPTSHCRLRTADLALPTSHCRLRTADFVLSTSHCRPRTADFALPTSHRRLFTLQDFCCQLHQTSICCVCVVPDT
jgi:hypothetical protein